MTDVTYGVSEEKYSLGTVTRISYGIVVYSNSGTDGTAAVIASARDVCADKQRMENLAEKLNRLEVSPIHLYDVIADLLAE